MEEHWLSDRKQKVRVGGELSKEGEVGSGVPQGTVLGPCLFSVFIDDADDCTIGTTNIIKFADDTKCWKVVENDSDMAELQETLDRLIEWADKWGMSFNADKCKVMHIGLRNPRHPYFMNGVKLGTTEEEKDVGVYVNPTLKPSNHCKRVAEKARAVLYATKLQKTFNIETSTLF
jgi:ribonuclease P/MRP protein subunit RPP40